MGIELSNLRPAKGSVKYDSFRRGRGQVRETARRPARATRARRLVREEQDLALKAVRCLYTEEFPRGDLPALIIRKLPASI